MPHQGLEQERVDEVNIVLGFSKATHQCRFILLFAAGHLGNGAITC